MHTAHLFEVYSSIYNDRLGAHLEGMKLNSTSMRDSSCTALCPTDSSCIGSCSFAQGEDVKMTSVKKHQKKTSEPIEWLDSSISFVNLSLHAVCEWVHLKSFLLVLFLFLVAVVVLGQTPRIWRFWLTLCNQRRQGNRRLGVFQAHGRLF